MNRINAVHLHLCRVAAVSRLVSRDQLIDPAVRKAWLGYYREDIRALSEWKMLREALRYQRNAPREERRRSSGRERACTSVHIHFL